VQRLRAPDGHQPEADGGEQHAQRRQDACGHPIELLSGAREAQLSALGVVSGFYRPDGVVGDLGGGSLELIEVAGARVGEGMTLPLGGLTLQDLSGGSLKKAQRLAREALARVPQLRKLNGRSFYAVGGTWRALARLHMAARNYPLHVMHGYRISPQDSLDFLQLVERVDAEMLKDIESVSEARRPLLAYGAVVLQEILRAKPTESKCKTTPAFRRFCVEGTGIQGSPDRSRRLPTKPRKDDNIGV